MLAHAIVREGAKAVAAGMNPMDLKRGVDLAVEAVVEDLQKNSKKVTSNEEIAQVGTISANGDAEIGRFLAEAMKKVGNEGVITVEEAKSLETELEVVEGMQFDRGYISPYFVTNADKMRVEMRGSLHPDLREEALRPAGAAAAARSGGADRQAAASSSPRTSRARRSPRWWSTSCAAASRSRPSRRRASAIAARRCSRTSRS